MFIGLKPRYSLEALNNNCNSQTSYVYIFNWSIFETFGKLYDCGYSLILYAWYLRIPCDYPNSRPTELIEITPARLCPLRDNYDRSTPPNSITTKTLLFYNHIYHMNCKYIAIIMQYLRFTIPIRTITITYTHMLHSVESTQSVNIVVIASKDTTYTFKH